MAYYGANLFYGVVFIGAIIFTVAVEALRWYFKVMARIVKRILRRRAK